MATNKAAKKTAKKAGKKTAEKHAKKAAAKKKSAAKKKASGAQTCWPGYKRVAGTKAGSKGSCEPKAHQSGAEKKADSRAAAARKREKTSHE
jgi:hypothetical protein